MPKRLRLATLHRTARRVRRQSHTVHRARLIVTLCILGALLAAGAPDEVITDDMLRETYGVQAQIARVSDRKICIFG